MSTSTSRTFLFFREEDGKKPVLRPEDGPVVLTDRVLFGAEGEDGSDGGSFARRQVAGNESNGKKQKACGYDSREVAGRKPEEHAGDKPSRGKAGGNANRDPEQSQRERFAQNHPTNASLLRAERNANADFAGAASDAVGHQPVEPDRGEQESESGKESRKQSDHSLVDEKAARHLVDRCRAKRIFAAEGLDLVADGHRQRFGILFGAYVKVVRLSPLWGKLEIRKVNHLRGGIAQVENPSILSNAHDFEILERRPKAVTNGVRQHHHEEKGARRGFC